MVWKKTWKPKDSRTRKKSNQKPTLLSFTISRPVSHLEALSHDFKVSSCCSLKCSTDHPCRTPQHAPNKWSKAVQRSWGGWHYLTEHGTWHSSAFSVSQRHPRFLPKSMLPLLTVLCSSCLQEYTRDFGTTAVKSWSVILWGAFPPPALMGRTQGKVKQSSYSLPQHSKSHPPMPTHAYTDTLQQEPCAYSSKHSPRQWKEKGPS